MSKKELARSGVLARVKAGELLVKDGAVLMKVSERQAKRLWKSYRTGGAVSLKHGDAGRRSNRARAAKHARSCARWRKNTAASERRSRPSICYKGEARMHREIEPAPSSRPRSGGWINRPSPRTGNRQRATHGGGRRCCWPLPPLRPDRWTNGLAGLRSGSGQQHGKQRVAEERVAEDKKRGHFSNVIDISKVG